MILKYSGRPGLYSNPDRPDGARREDGGVHGVSGYRFGPVAFRRVCAGVGTWVERYGWRATVSFVFYSDQNSVRILSEVRKIYQNLSEILKVPE